MLLLTLVSVAEADRPERGVPLDEPPYWTDQPVSPSSIDLANPRELARRFDYLVLANLAGEWKHFKAIRALPEIIAAFRAME